MRWKSSVHRLSDRETVNSAFITVPSTAPSCLGSSSVKPAPVKPSRSRLGRGSLSWRFPNRAKKFSFCIFRFRVVTSLRQNKKESDYAVSALPLHASSGRGMTTDLKINNQAQVPVRSSLPRPTGLRGSRSQKSQPDLPVVVVS